MTMRPGAIVAGVILLGVGTAMLLDNTGMLRVRLGGLIAPLVLITMGSSIVLDGAGKGGDALRPAGRHHRSRPAGSG